jgi:hypothetical protein
LIQYGQVEQVQLATEVVDQYPKKEPCSDRFRQSPSVLAGPVQLLHVKDGNYSSLKEKKIRQKASLYVRTRLMKTSSTVYTGELRRLRGQLGEKYFDYSTSCSDNSNKNTSATLSSTSSTTSTLTAACHARGLVIAHSRIRANYRQRSRARHQLAPEYKSSRSRPTISSISATRRSQQRSGARQQLRLRSWL